MMPTSSLFSDMSTRGPFVCRSCLVSLRAAQRRPTRPPWAATATAAVAPTMTTTTTISVRTLTRHASAARGRTRRADGAARPAVGRAQQPPIPATPVQPPPSRPLVMPTLDDLQLAARGDPRNEYGRDEDVTVRFFDQQDDGSIVPVDNGNNRRGSSLGREAEQQLRELEGKLRDTALLVKNLENSGGAARRRSVRLRRKYDMIKEVEQEEEEAEALEEALGEMEEGEDRLLGGGMAAAAATAAAAVKIDDTGLTANARRHVKNLNNILRPAARRLQKQARGGDASSSAGVDAKLITALWSRYGAARTGLAESWSNIPPAVWSCLWTVLAWDDSRGGSGGSGGGSGQVKNPRRMSHIYFLAKDMQAAGVALTDAQQLLAMEAMFIEGWPAAALENWRRGAATLGARPTTAVDYWELGVRMCAVQGDLERAERAADRLFSSELEDLLRGSGGGIHKTRGDPRALFQLIRSAAAQDVQGAQDKAWATYRRLRALLDGGGNGSNGMKIEDYDEVVSCFLTANHTEYAFDVFVDMMFSGALDVHRQQLQQGLRPGKLPSAVANHFFFGKWLKRLIGAGDLDGAYRVLQFMQARGVMTASVQVNGLLGAWLRSGTAANQARADALAWRMVESRRLFVDLRRREQQMEWPLKLQLSGPARPKINVSETVESSETEGEDLTFVPRATLETFSLMADNYKNRGQLAQLERLWVAFRECEMASTDAFMMNQLLESYVHDGRADEARELYRDLVLGPQKIVPNAHTFLALFRSLAVHRTMFRTMTDEQRRATGADCRQLVADMVKLAGIAFRSEGESADEVKPRETAFYQALGRMVLHSFRKTGDYVGLCVMLQILRPLLSTGGGQHSGQPRFAMSDSLAVELVAESSDLQRDTPAARHRIFKASEVVEVLLREVRLRQLSVYGQRQRLRSGTDDAADQSLDQSLDLSDDLAAVVAHVYRLKCEGVSDEAFAEMYEAAVDELRVRKFLVR